MRVAPNLQIYFFVGKLYWDQIKFHKNNTNQF